MEYYLEIKEPCTVEWNTMSITERGKFCDSCEKELIDFVHFSDERLVDFLQKNDKKFCGRLTEHQLSRPINLIKKKSRDKNYLKLASGFLLLNFVTTDLKAENTKSETVKVHQLNLKNEAKNITQIDTLILRGKLMDVNTGSAIQGVLVSDYVNGFVKTDKEGKFKLTIKHRVSDTLSLYIEHCSYSDSIINIPFVSLNDYLEIKLDSSDSNCNFPVYSWPLRQVEGVVPAVITEKIVQGNMEWVDAGPFRKRSLFGIFRRKNQKYE